MPLTSNFTYTKADSVTRFLDPGCLLIPLNAGMSLAVNDPFVSTLVSWLDGSKHVLYRTETAIIKYDSQ